MSDVEQKAHDLAVALLDKEQVKCFVIVGKRNTLKFFFVCFISHNIITSLCVARQKTTTLQV